jgi:hypothetical protein
MAETAELILEGYLKAREIEPDLIEAMRFKLEGGQI